MTYKEKYQMWLDNRELDKSLKAELECMKNDDEAIKFSFGTDLEFGTAGLRGIMGAGTAKMNIYTVRRASLALAKYMYDAGIAESGVAIAYDSRINSRLFAEETAKVLAKAGVRVYLFDDLRPTPELSFAVRYLKCGAGVVITASHNPKEYNGYKVYGADGGQVVNEAADAILAHMENIGIFDAETADMSSVEIIGKEVDEAFYEAILKESLNPDAAAKANLKIVYTPFHGAGLKGVCEVLKRLGIKNVIVEPKQAIPDGSFPTVKSPNPENPDGFKLAVELAKKEDVDLIIGTDPDSDRVGVIVRDDMGEYIPLTGNMTGALLVDYVLSQKKNNGTLPENAVVIKTIVTNEIIKEITDFYGAELVNVLTGFKFIAEKIKEYEETGSKTYVFGFEESYGYLPGTYVRDKDAVGASMLIAEMASWYKLQGMSLYDAYCALAGKYGHYGEWVDNIYFEGLGGKEKIAAIMENLRANAPAEIAGSRIIAYSDVLEGYKYDTVNGTKEKLPFTKSNVLRYETEDGAFVAFRPSGTEPKFKVYAGFKAENIKEKAAQIKADVEKIIGK